MILHLLEVIDKSIDIGQLLYGHIVVGCELSLGLLLITGFKGGLFAILDLVYLFFVYLGEVAEGRESAIQIGDLV